MKLFFVIPLLFIVICLLLAFLLFVFVFSLLIKESEDKSSELEFFTSDGQLREDVFGPE